MITLLQTLWVYLFVTEGDAECCNSLTRGVGVESLPVCHREAAPPAHTEIMADAPTG